MFDMDYIFHTIPQKHVAFDWDTFHDCKIRFLTGAMNCASGTTVWFEKEEITSEFDASIASCSVPILSPIRKLKGFELLDGGVTDPIPVENPSPTGIIFMSLSLPETQGT